MYIEDGAGTELGEAHLKSAFTRARAHSLTCTSTCMCSTCACMPALQSSRRFGRLQVGPWHLAQRNARARNLINRG
eukprot:scaffold118019_cov19-Tisochrysis_lutea.AAC.2